MIEKIPGMKFHHWEWEYTMVRSIEEDYELDRLKELE